MWVFWIAAFLPICICGILVLLNKAISYKEWLITSVVAFVMAGFFQLVVSQGMTDDIETWSGYVTSSRQFSRWQEYYEYAVYRTEYYTDTETYYTTDSEGRSQSHTRTVTKSRQVFDHWEPDKRWHEASWEVYTTIGDWDIDQVKHIDISQKFKDNHPVPGRRKTGEHNSRMIGGDPNDYIADNKTGWIEPVTTTKHFENRIKAAPSLFSYSKVPTNILVHPWPKSQYLFASDRVMGTAKSSISTLKWDQMNAVLGASKKVNLIIVGYGDRGMDMAGWQEAAWIGGKKNDLVICYGGKPNEKASWVKVFGWTEKNIVKQNLQTMLLNNPINDDLIPAIQSAVVADYVIKDWHKFDYITIEPPGWSYWVYFGVMVLIQGGLFFFYHMNEINQDTDGSKWWRWPKTLANFLIKMKNSINPKVRTLEVDAPLVNTGFTKRYNEPDAQKKSTSNKCGIGGT